MFELNFVNPSPLTPLTAGSFGSPLSINSRMIDFKTYLAEELSREENLTLAKSKFSDKKKFKWAGTPKIGWWADRNTLLMYHGTHHKNLLGILENGIFAPTSGPTANWVSMALEPNTAFGYASMGGESSFRAAGANAQHIPPQDRVVLVAKFPMSFVKKQMEKDYRGNVQYTRNRLTDKSEYEAWKKSDQEYYALTEIRFPKKIDPKYIIGYMTKK